MFYITPKLGVTNMSIYPSPFAFITPVAVVSANFNVSTFETGDDGWLI
jgi:hypothetical protein